MNYKKPYTICTATTIVLLAFVQNAFADIALSEAAKNLMQPLSHFTLAIFNICYILAIVLLMGTLTQYRNYRQNPNQTPLSRPIIMLLLTLATALIPTIGKLSISAAYL